MLAILFDFPWEDRRTLTRWSDLATALPKSMIYDSEEQRLAELGECADYSMRLWNERVNVEPRSDLISMMAHSDATRHMDRNNLLGNLILLIVGGNDTTRNSMTGSVLALNENPDEYDKLRSNHALIDSFVPEVIRWQTPLAHMRRTALQDIQVGGKLIKKGDRVVMWYVSGNRDGEVIENADSFIIDRARPRTHVSFGFGIHRSPIWIHNCLRGAHSIKHLQSGARPNRKKFGSLNSIDRLGHKLLRSSFHKPEFRVGILRDRCTKKSQISISIHFVPAVLQRPNRKPNFVSKAINRRKLYSLNLSTLTQSLHSLRFSIRCQRPIGPQAPASRS
jgi:hypothetical protein